MAKDTYLQVRIDPELKAEANELFSTMGITTSDAVRLFLVKCLNEKGIPFQLNTSGAQIKE